jgi:hypothetical protein
MYEKPVVFSINQPHWKSNTDGLSPGWLAHVDLRLHRLTPVLEERHDLVGRIEALKAAPEPDPTRAAAAHVARVFAAAGGPAVVVARMREVLYRRLAHHEIDEAGGALKAQEQKLEELGSRLERIAKGAEPSIDAARLAALQAELDSMTAATQTLRADVEERQTARIQGVVDRALAGDTPARLEVASAAESYPQGFPRGFAASLDPVPVMDNGAVLDILAAEIIRAEIPEHSYRPVPVPVP